MSQLFVPTLADATQLPGVYAIDQEPPAAPQNPGQEWVGVIARFAWGPTGAVTVIDSPSGYLDLFAPGGLAASYASTGHRALARAKIPRLKIVRVAATGQATALMTLTDGAGSPGRDVMANKNLEWLPPSTAAARPVAPGKGIYFHLATDTGAVSAWDGSAWQSVGDGGGGAADPGVPNSGLVVDWRASVLVLSDGDPVGSWAPSTGTGTLTAAGGARPTYRATGSPAGTPAVEFDASSSQALTLAGVAGLPTSAAAGTVIAIVSRLRPVGGAGLQHLWQYGHADTLSARGMVVTSADNIRSHVWAGGITETRSPRGQGLRVIAHSYDGTRESIIVDGVDYGTGDVALTTGTAEGIAVGSNLVAGEFGNFKLMRLFGYSRVLSAADWRQIAEHARIYEVQ